MIMSSVHSITDGSRNINSWIMLGFTEDIYGPTSLIHHDLNLLYNSMINNRFKTLQQGNVDQYIVFGDSAYPKESHLTTYKERREANNEHVNWIKAMKYVRISIEWN